MLVGGIESKFNSRNWTMFFEYDYTSMKVKKKDARKMTKEMQANSFSVISLLPDPFATCWSNLRRIRQPRTSPRLREWQLHTCQVGPYLPTVLAFRTC
jgi:hypothetical protein